VKILRQVVLATLFLLFAPHLLAAPSVTIDQAAAQSDPTGASPIVFTVVFSEAVPDFSSSDVSLAGSSLAGLTAFVSGSGANYTVTVTGMNGTGTVVASIPAGVATGATGANLASTSSDNTVTFDSVRPTVTINQAAGQADPTNALPILFTVAFSEPVTGFTGSDISFTGSTAGGSLAASVSGSGASYTVSVNGTATNGVLVVSIPANAATDLAGNQSLASTSADNSVTFDNVRPTVTIDQAPVQADPTNASPIRFTVAFSEPTTTFTAADVSLAGSSLSGLSASVTGSGASYTVGVTGMNGSGTVVASIPAGAATDLAGNAVFASTSADNTVFFDNVRPTVTINQAPAQADPVETSPIQFNVTFGKPVTGFTGSDVSFAGSTVGGALSAAVSGSGASYTVSVTGMSGSGTVVASVPANAATDAVGNTSLASTSADNTVTFDNARPSVTIDKASTQADPTNASPVFFTVTFSEPVTGFTEADVSFAGSTVGGTLFKTVSGSGASYTVSVSGMSGSGTLVASIPADVATDGLGHLNFASTSTDNSVAFDDVRPTVAIDQAAAQQDPAGGSPIVFTVAFSEPVIGFTGIDVSFVGSTAGGTLAAAVSGSGANYTVSVTGMASSGTVVASLPANAAIDLAGNTSLASASADNTVSFVGASEALSADPGSLDFGGQSMNTTAPPRTVTISNESATPITPGSLTTSANFAVTHDCTTIAPGGSCVATVTFTPGVEGPVAGSLLVANGASQLAVSLAGVGERSLVTHYYQSILRRAPDAGGKAFWLGEAARTQSLGLDPNEVWYAMAQQFYASAEYQAFGRDDTGFVTDLYDTFFNRAPDSGGMSFWTSQLASGMPREVVLTAFTFSAEFVAFSEAIFGTHAVRAELNVVTDFYRGLLSRLPDDAGFDYWLARFRAAQCTGPGAVSAEADAISRFFASGPEYASRSRTDAQFVGDLYNAFLRRGGDLDGVQYWIGQLTSGARTRDEVRQAFLGSSEFQGRVNQVVAAGCYSP
jgi:hypothetical protein